MICRDFWQGKRVFVTGHTGFKGSWLCLWLQMMGADVQGYSLAPPTQPNLFTELGLEKNIATVVGDVRDGESLYKSISRYKPDMVFHMAAQSLVRLSYESPLDTYSTNVMGLVSLFEAVRKIEGIKAVVNITSDKCYENQEWVWGYRESEPMGGFDPYSCSKGCAELITSSYRRSFFNPETYHEHGCAVASARAGNVIGGGDWAPDRLVPDVIKAFSNKETLNIRNPLSIRPWQHVLEPLSGYLMLAEKLYIAGCEFADGWNFGPKEDSTQSVQWIVQRMATQWGEDAQWQVDGLNHPHEAHCLKLDCSKANYRLDWQPVWGLEYTLDRTVSWYKAWRRGEDMHDYTIAEINHYMNSKGGL